MNKHATEGTWEEECEKEEEEERHRVFEMMTAAKAEVMIFDTVIGSQDAGMSPLLRCQLLAAMLAAIARSTSSCICVCRFLSEA